MNAMLKRWICRTLGHDWQQTELHYEQGETTALVGDTWQRVGVTWIGDERCRRCGAETWWPT